MELLLQFFPFSGVPKGDTLWHVFSGGSWLFKQQPHLLLYLSSFSKVGRHHPEEQESPEQHIIIQHLLLFCSRKVRKTMFLPSPFSDWSRSSFFWVMPQHRSGAAIWATNYSFKFSMHSCAHQPSVDPVVGQHVVVGASFHIDLQELIWVSMELFPRPAQSEACLLTCVDVGDEPIFLKPFSLSSVHRQIFPIPHIHN